MTTFKVGDYVSYLDPTRQTTGRVAGIVIECQPGQFRPGTLGDLLVVKRDDTDQNDYVLIKRDRVKPLLTW